MLPLGCIVYPKGLVKLASKRPIGILCRCFSAGQVFDTNPKNRKRGYRLKNIKTNVHIYFLVLYIWLVQVVLLLQAVGPSLPINLLSLLLQGPWQEWYRTFCKITKGLSLQQQFPTAAVAEALGIAKRIKNFFHVQKTF